MLGKVKQTVLNDDGTEMLDTIGVPMVNFFPDNTGTTALGKLIDMMSCCEKLDSGIPKPINPKLQDSSQQTDCSYCVEALIHLVSFNHEFKNFGDFNGLSNLLNQK